MLALRLCSPGTLAVALLLCATPTAPAALTISEFQAVNNSTTRDEDGDYSDWIEIHNPTSTEQNLDGWYLTDSALRLTKWRAPNVVLPSGGYLVVFASDRNRTNTTAGRLHTNFKLNADGEYLALVDPSGNVVSEFAPTYPKWPPAEVSFGRDRNEPSLVGFFSVPTPGNPNQAGGPGEFAPDIVFSRESGTYVDSFQLTLALWPPNSAAEIRYVIVNSAATAAQTNVPTSASALYTGPITVTGTMQVRTRAFEAGRLPGTPASASFIQISANAVTFTSDLPLVVVHNFGSATIPNSSDQTAIVAWFDVDERTGRSSLTNRPTLITRAGVNRRGSSTEGYPKASLAVELWDEFNEDADHEVLGLPPESDWVLDAGNIFDPSHIHDAFAYELSNDLGRYAPRTRMVETFIDLTGGAINLPDFTSASDYHGIHVLEEKVKRNQNRVNIDRIQQENTTTPGVTGGWLFKIDRNDPDERTFNGAGATIIYMEPDGRNVQLPQWDAQEQYIRSYFTNFGAALNGPNWTNSIPGYAAYIDVDSWIDHHLMNVLTLSVDSLRLSAHFYKPRNGKIEMGPVWDFGRALGANAKGADWRPFNPRAWRAANTLGGTDYGTDFFNASTPPPWWARLFTDPDFFQRYIDIYQRHRATVFDTNRILAKIDRLAELVRDAQTREALRWSGPGSSDSSPRSGTVTSPVNIYGNTYSYTFPTPGTYQGEIDFLKHWLSARIHFMDTNFLDRPFFGRDGGLITAPIELGIAEPSTEEGTRVLYTLDGADPRLPGGGVSPSARVYSGPFLVATNAHVVARSHNVNHRNLTGPGHPPISSPWSGAAEIVLYRSLPALRITEVMYHPPSLPGDTNAADEFEYIEVTNTGTTILNLGGFRIRGGIEFDFGGLYLGPGQSAVVVANSAAFISRYGNQRMILGVHSDRLSNAGERLILEGPLREPIHDFTYSDTWHPITDGHGFSLAIRNPSLHVAAWDSAVNWRSSGASGIPPILVNEVLTHPAAPSTDTIELHNPTPFQVDISGWFLTDDFSVPTKYRIPENTVVAANGFVLFNEAQFNTGPRAFALSSLGDEVWLFSGDGTNLTGYAHGFEFGAAFNGVTFGRNVRSSGGDDLPAQAIATLGTLSGVPRVGPIVISEIMYHPRSVMRHTVARDNHLDEFIELENITDQLVPLHDVQRPTNTWRLRGAVEFDFPAGEAVPAHARILIVGFDPADTLKLDSFRARNGVSPAIPIYGPFRGTLDNASAAIELSRPDRPEPSGPPYFGLVPYPLVERIEYSALPPWPAAADDVGASLQRLFASFYGNDPINWRAALPTPGGSPASKNPPIVTQQPASQTVIAFNIAVFSVEANGAGNRYQWRFNGAPIFRETNDTLTLPNVQKNQQGVYDAVIYNAEGSMTSAEARLTVLVPMALTRQPQSVIMRGSTNSATYGHTFSNAAFSVAAISTSPLSYQWRHNRNDIPGATARIFAITNANLTHEGLYDCVLSDSVSTQRTAAAQLRIDVPLHILRQPQPVIALEGDDVALSVEHVGSGPFGYRWRRNGINIHPGSGYTSLRVLNISDVTTNSSGAYTVVVTNIVPPGVLSGGAALTVLADSDHDQAPDTWETEFGFLPNDPADGSMDFDQDGVTNADEFRSGTDPRDNASYLRVEEFTLDGVASASRLSFHAVSNRTYSVQYKDMLVAASIWTTLENVVAERASRTAVVIDPARAPNRFYRLVTPLVQE